MNPNNLSVWICLLVWKGFYISRLCFLSFLPPLNCCHLSEPSQLQSAGRLHRHARLCSRCTAMHAGGTFPRIHEQNVWPVRPSALIVARVRFKPRPRWPRSEAERLRDPVYSNPRFFSLLHPALSLCLSFSLYLWLCSHSVIIQHRDPPHQKINKIKSLNRHLNTTAIHKDFGARTKGFCLLPVAQHWTHRYKQSSVSIWRPARQTDGILGEKASWRFNLAQLACARDWGVVAVNDLWGRSVDWLTDFSDPVCIRALFMFSLF